MNVDNPQNGVAGDLEETALNAAENSQKQVAREDATALLRDDLRKLAKGDEFWATCEGCGAPMLLSDDYVSSEDGVSGCWHMMTENPPPDRPCFAYRVGKTNAVPEGEAA